MILRTPLLRTTIKGMVIRFRGSGYYAGFFFHLFVSTYAIYVLLPQPLTFSATLIHTSEYEHLRSSLPVLVLTLRRCRS